LRNQEVFDRRLHLAGCAGLSLGAIQPRLDVDGWGVPQDYAEAAAAISYVVARLAERAVMRVGILDLLTDVPLKGPLSRAYAAYFRKQFVSIGPQAVSAWCRRFGHDVTYATYYGQQDPRSLLPSDLDMVFIAAHTPCALLAYALAKVFRAEKVRTVLGGPHAKSFPEDASRFFDIVVTACDRSLIGDILGGHVDPPAILASGRPLTEIPTVAERRPEIEASAFTRGRSGFVTVVPMLTSVGCPYSCNFCVDWNSKYVSLPDEQIRQDLRYVSERFPRAFVGYHDPNFAVRFDETMDMIASVPEGRRNRYVMESSLSILKESRLTRLRETNCFYVAPGIESWTDYSNKAGTAGKAGRGKLEQIVDHLRLLARVVPGIQANIMVGTESDRGTDPIELTKEFIWRLPEVWPTINIPTPFGGTPLYEQYLAEGRVLRTMPFAFYYNPYLAIRLKHYTVLAYYDHLIDIHEKLASNAMLARRLRTGQPLAVRFLHSLRTYAARKELRDLRRIRKMLANNMQFLAFHEGETETLPEFYHCELRRRLGPYASLLNRTEIKPIFAPLSTPPMTTSAV
jgi:radical SAM superfamily enzyme YgiQ (UPF0313 family)